VSKRASQLEKPLTTRIAIAVFAINWLPMFPFLGFSVVLA
jgi:hypothetical protein